jgi:hypothetical protein
VRNSTRFFPLTIFLSAFLLFQIQPMMGRFVLPWFGGTPSVWTTCMLFFQAALLGGYLYAHWLGSFRDPRAAGWMHAGVLAFSLLFLPVAPRADLWKPFTPDAPVRQILTLLAANAAGPFFVLASTAPLLQRWFSLRFAKSSPWRLYALSNLGSFLALLSYPFAVEPFFRLRTQAWIWSALYAAFAALTAWISLRLPQASGLDADVAPDSLRSEPAPISSDSVILWLGLSAAGSTLLLAVTNEISQEIAVVPFLWIAPLAIYLLTFVIAFDHERWYRRGMFAVLAGVLAPVACAVVSAAIGIALGWQIAVHLAALFSGCMLCHGELVRARPSTRHLTAFYLTIAAGGALGGIFTGVLAPRIFTRSFLEYPIGFAAACLLGLVAWLRGGALRQWTSQNFAVRIPLMALLLGGLSAAVAAANGTGPGIANVRNFYGLLRISEYFGPITDPVRQLTHGRIKHGFQFLSEKERDLPTSYYGPHSGVALAINALPQPRRIAVVGLGTGTIAAWGRSGDRIRFYEINPAVQSIARTWFSYLNDSQAAVDVTLGDARVQMERELAQGQSHDYGLIAVDAFSSDSIPLHLLTAECAEVYRQRLIPGGVLAIHISNRALNLEPVVRALAEHLGWGAAMVLSADDPKLGEDSSRWVLVTGNQDFLRNPAIAENATGWTLPARPPVLWTDDFASLWHVLK